MVRGFLGLRFAGDPYASGEACEDYASGLTRLSQIAGHVEVCARMLNVGADHLASITSPTETGHLPPMLFRLLCWRLGTEVDRAPVPLDANLVDVLGAWRDVLRTDSWTVPGDVHRSFDQAARVFAALVDAASGGDADGVRVLLRYCLPGAFEVLRHIAQPRTVRLTRATADLLGIDPGEVLLWSELDTHPVLDLHQVVREAETFATLTDWGGEA